MKGFDDDIFDSLDFGSFGTGNDYEKIDYEKILEDIPISEIEKFLRKKKLETIKNGKNNK